MQSKKRSVYTIVILMILLSLALPGFTSRASTSVSTLVINEIDYDQPGSDNAEFVEIMNAGGSPINLFGYSLVFVDGDLGGASIYRTIPLPDTELAAGDYFVVCADPATVPYCDMDVFPNAGLIQNGAPDAVALVQDTTVIDTVSYEGNTGAPYTETSGVDLVDRATTEDTDMGISRCPDGGDTDVNNVDLIFSPTTPGYDNSCGGLVINEVDADNYGTDGAEFVEIFDGGWGNTSLDGTVLVFYNGSGDSSYAAYDLSGYATDAEGYFVVCGNAANVANCDLDVSPDTNMIQNGADAVALYTGLASNFPNGTPVTTTDLIDALVYDTNDGDDAGLLALLNPAQPQINEDAKSGADSQSNQRCPNGSGGARNTSPYDQFNPTPGVQNACAPAVEIGVCTDPATSIHDIQGASEITALLGETHVVEGVVVGDFQDTSTGLGGFYIQEEDADADGDTNTSEGLFVYDNGFGVDVAEGDIARVLGNVTEYFGMTALSAVYEVAVCSSGNTVTPSPVTLPIALLSDWEIYEGMLISVTNTLYATDNYNQGRYGEVHLSAVNRLYNPTNVVLPGAPALAVQDLNDRSRILMDDGSNVQNPLPLPPYLAPDNTLRLGDTTEGLLGVLSYGFSAYRVHPTAPLTFSRENDRVAAPSVPGGNVKVASFNVLNYFTTLDTGPDICGPTGNLECRGADTAAEFTRQHDKIVSALVGLDADVVGLIEIENNASTAIESLVDGLNTVMGAGTYDYIDTGTIGLDAIKVALIYKPAVVTPVGSHAILDSIVDPDFLDDKNRPVLAQTFEANLGYFTVAVNHLKSKGSACDDVGDPDTGDGQGNCNLTRTAAANALADWLATDPTGSGDPDFLIIGDLNAYAKEDPIAALQTEGYTDLIDAYLTDAYSYTFFGQAGYLDHALANAAMATQVLGAGIWHINADEPSALDYNDYNQPLLYNADPYRASDHDPVVVFLNVEPNVQLWMPFIMVP